MHYFAAGSGVYPVALRSPNDCAMLRLPSLLVLVALLAGCDATSPGPAPASSLELGGALQATFPADAATEALTTVQTTPNGARTLVLRLRAEQEHDGQERAELTVRLPMDGELVPGRYPFDLGAAAQADLSYTLDRAPDLLALYRFRGRSLVLDITQVDEAVLAGEVRVVAEQTFGTRTLFGQREEVVLAGPVTARAAFEAAFVAP